MLKPFRWGFLLKILFNEKLGEIFININTKSVYVYNKIKKVDRCRGKIIREKKRKKATMGNRA